MAQYTFEQISSLLQKQGVPREKIPTMVAIAGAESGGNAKAFNPTGLDESYGFFQVNMRGGLGPERMKQFGLKSKQDLFDPETNVRAAKAILGSQGLGAWTTYTSGKYKQYLPQAQKALENLGQQGTDQTQQQPTQSSSPGNEFLATYIDRQNQLLQKLIDYKKDKSTENDDPYGLKNISIAKPINPQDLASQLMQSTQSYV